MTLSTLASELAAAGRGLVRRPLVPLVLATVVAVGVAFLVTAFSVFDALLWRDAPYGPHERFMLLGEARDADSFAPTPRIRVDAYEAYQEAFDRGRIPALEGLIPFEERNASLVVDGVVSKEVATRLLPDAYALLQAAPMLGRVPADPDGGARLAREVAIGEQLWTRRFRRRADVLGQHVTLDGEPAVIVGVMPAWFRFHRTAEIWSPWSDADVPTDPAQRILLAGRLAEGASRSEIIDQVETIRRAVRAARTPRDTTSRGQVGYGLFGRQFIPMDLAKSILWSMALVLVAAALNLATLYLARLRLRAPDYATRQALGAGPAGVLRLLLSEIALVVAAGGAAAVVVSLLVLGNVRDRMSNVFLSWVDVRLDGRGFVIALATLAVVLAVVALPAARLLRRLDLARLLTHKGVLGGAPKHGRGASALIATQVAVVVFLAAASLPIAISATKLTDVRSGLADDRIVEVYVTLTGAAYEEESARDAYAERVRAAFRGDPRFLGASRTGTLLEWRSGPTSWSDTIWTDASPDPIPRRRSWRVSEQVVSASYFDVAGLPMVAGGTFDGGAGAGGERVAVLSAEAARRLWPDQPAVGRRFRRGAEGAWVRVVGVVGDQTAIREDWNGTTAEPDPLVYLSDRQAIAGSMSFHVRVRQATPTTVRDVRAAIERVDPMQPVSRARWLSETFAVHRTTMKWLAVVLGSGAVAAVLLAMTGVIGLVSYYTTARLPELALRVALGAPLRRVVWLVARGTLRSVGVGLACGALTLAIVQDGIGRFTYETSTLSPSTLALIAGAVLAVALVALLVPLGRLRRLSPQELLRAD